jgi:molecular chaperone GrpE
MTRKKRDDPPPEGRTGPEQLQPQEPAGEEGDAREVAPEGEAVSAAGAADSESVADGGGNGEEPAVAAEDPLAICRQERDEFQDRWLRALAELDNQRKRARRELEEQRRLAVADLVRGLLDVLDDFERAAAMAPEPDGEEPAGFRAGVELIHQRLRQLLGERGLSRIEAVGQEFDPNLHEAIGQIELEGVPSGQIVEVLRPGYIWQDLVIRPSMVMVAK